MIRKGWTAMGEFFAGITLPEHIRVEVERWRRQFRAPKTVPHITLLAPFELADVNQLLAAFEYAVKQHHPFKIQSTGLGHFGKAVIYVDIDPSKELLSLQSRLAQTLIEIGIKPEKRSYHPHITLATRLHPAEFERYQQQLVEYQPQYCFMCRAVTVFALVEEGKLKRWYPYADLPLKE